MNEYCDKCGDLISDDDVPIEYENHWATEIWRKKNKTLCFLCFLQFCVSVKRLNEKHSIFNK